MDFELKIVDCTVLVLSYFPAQCPRVESDCKIGLKLSLFAGKGHVNTIKCKAQCSPFITDLALSWIQI